MERHPNIFSNNGEKGWTQAQWKESLASNLDMATFGVFRNGDLIGIAFALKSPKDETGSTGNIAASYIIPACRGQGLSAMLHEIRIEWALRHPKWKRLFIAHREDNFASGRAILKAGYELTGKRKITYPDGREATQCFYSMDLEKLRREKGVNIEQQDVRPNRPDPLNHGKSAALTQ